MRSRNKDVIRKANTFQSKPTIKGDTTPGLSETMDFADDVDEWNTEGRHKAADLKVHLTGGLGKYGIQATKGIKSTTKAETINSSVYNYTAAPSRSTQERDIRGYNPFRKAKKAMNQQKEVLEEFVSKPDDSLDEELLEEGSEYFIYEDVSETQLQGSIPAELGDNFL